MNRLPAIFERQRAEIEQHIAGGSRPIRSIAHVREIKTSAELMRGTGRLKPEAFFVALEPPHAQYAHIDLNEIDRYYLGLTAPIQTTPIQRLFGRGKTVPITWRPTPEKPDGPLKFIRVVASKTDSVNLANALQFLLSIGDRVSFEVVGDSYDVTFQIACAEAYFQRLVGILQTHYEVSEFVETDEDAILEMPMHEVWVAEYGLDTTHFIPIRSLGGFDVEPMHVLMGIYDEIDPGEAGALQVLFQPCQHNWARNIRQASVTELTGEPISDDPNLTPLVDEKIQVPFFAVCVRTIATNPELLSRFTSYLRQFDVEHNQFVPLPDSMDDPDLVAEGITLRMARRPGMLLNANEMVSLAHLPPQSLFSDKLSRVKIEKIRAPRSLIDATEGILIGENPYHNHRYQVRVPPALLNKHMLLAGSTRMGKSTLMSNMIKSLIGAGKGVFLIDPKGSLAKEIAGSIPPERVESTIYFNPGDREHPVAMNLMRFAKHYDHQELINDLVAILDKITVTLMPATPRMWELFSGAMRHFLTLAEDDPSITLRNVRDFFHDTKYRRGIVDAMTDSLARRYWVAYEEDRANRRDVDSAAMGLTSRLAQLVDDPTMANILCAEECRIDFREIFNREMVFITDLGDIGELRKNFLGRMLVAEAQLSCMARPADERTDVFFFLDEFQDYQTSAFEDVLARGAEYRMNMVLAHQNYAQVDNTTMQSVLGNAGTIIAFRVGEDYAARLQRSFAQTWDQNAFLGLPEYECLVRAEAKQFSLRSYSPDDYAKIEDLSDVPDAFEAVVAHTRERYAWRPDAADIESTDEEDRLRALFDLVFEPGYHALDEEQPSTTEEAHFTACLDFDVTQGELDLPEPDAWSSEEERFAHPAFVFARVDRLAYRATTTEFAYLSAVGELIGAVFPGVSLPVDAVAFPLKGQTLPEQLEVSLTPESSAAGADRSENAETPDLWACPSCGLEFKRRPGPNQRHLLACLRKKETADSLQHRCRHCERRFGSVQALRSHVGKAHPDR